MKVTFELQLFTGEDYESVPEDQIDAHRELLDRQAQIEGAVVLEGERQPRVSIEDDLWAAVQNVCFSMVTRMLREPAECVVYRRTNAEGLVVMVQSGPLIQLVGDEIRPFKARREELLPALYECGVRFVALLERLGDRHAATAEHLRGHEAEARSALETLGPSA